MLKKYDLTIDSKVCPKFLFNILQENTALLDVLDPTVILNMVLIQCVAENQLESVSHIITDQRINREIDVISTAITCDNLQMLTLLYSHGFRLFDNHLLIACKLDKTNIVIHLLDRLSQNNLKPTSECFYTACINSNITLINKMMSIKMKFNFSKALKFASSDINIFTYLCKKFGKIKKPLNSVSSDKLLKTLIDDINMSAIDILLSSELTELRHNVLSYALNKMINVELFLKYINPSLVSECIANEHYGVVEYCLRLNPKINIDYNDGEHLILCVYKGHHGLLKEYIALGANPRAHKDQGLILACNNKDSISLEILLNYSSYNDHSDAPFIRGKQLVDVLSFNMNNEGINKMIPLILKLLGRQISIPKLFLAACELGNINVIKWTIKNVEVKHLTQGIRIAVDNNQGDVINAIVSNN